MPSSSNQKVNDILSGCEDLLNDFSVPATAAATPSSHDKGSSSSEPPTELDRSKKAWGRAIDKYVASVLEDNKSTTSSTIGGGSSRRSGKSKNKKQQQHPDHLLAALQADAVSIASSSGSCSVNIDGHIDDSSFAPINPYGSDDNSNHSNSATPKSSNDSNPWKNKVEWLKQYLKEEWKPISLIVLVIFVTIIVSAAMGGDKNEGVNEGSGSLVGPDYAMGSREPRVSEFDTTTTALDNETNWPTFSPTWLEEYPTLMPTDSPVTAEPTWIEETDSPVTPSPSLSPTTKSPSTSPATQSPSTSPTTSSPTISPSSPPTMPERYFEMKKAAIYVSGSSKLLDTTSSAQSLAFHWLYYEGNPSSKLYEFFEQYATAVLFFSLTKARTSYAYMQPTGVYDSWTERKDVCGWDGVRCAFNYTSEMVHVTEIDLSNKTLTGVLPEKEIHFLPYVKTLDLSDNEIEGTVPDAVYGLSELRHLYLNNNKLTGTISSNIDNLNLAEQIYLGQNLFTGVLPANIGNNRPNNWRFFSIYDNKLTGVIHPGMKLRNAFMLDFSKNGFYGTIPEDISQENYSTLRLLYMNDNMLTGTIPGSLMQIKKMKGLFLNDNGKYEHL